MTLLLQTVLAASGLAIFFRGAPWSPERLKRKPWSCPLCAALHASWLVAGLFTAPNALATMDAVSAVAEITVGFLGAFAVATIAGRVALPTPLELA
jgi:hypothetical protein